MRENRDYKKKEQNKNNLQDHPPDKIKIIFYLLLIVALTYIVYLPLKKNKFVNLDDDRYIIENKYIQDLSPENIKFLLTKNFEGNYHPITMLSYALNYSIGKLNPKTYHFTNLLLHILNTCILFFLIYSLVNKINISFISAILFGIHPLHVESVAWASERKDVLYCFFFLLSLIFYVLYIKKPNFKYYILSLILFVFSLLSKGMAVSLSITIILIDYLENRKFTKKVILEKIPFLILSLIFGLIAISAQGVNEMAPQTSGFNFYERPILASYALTQYFLNLTLPINLSSFYPYPKNISIGYWLAFITIIVSLFILFYLFYKNRNQPAYKKYLFGLLFFIPNIIFVLQLLPVGNALMADRYTYVSSIGIFFIMAVAYENIIKSKKKYLYIIYLLVSLYVISLSILAFNRCKIWRNSITMWDDVIKKYPNVDFALNNRGLAKWAINDHTGALSDYNRAIVVNPKFALSYNNIGSINLELHNYNEAIIYYDKALKLNPNLKNSYKNRGKAKSAIKDHQGAMNDFSKFIELMPLDADAFNDRGIEKYNLKIYKEAIEDYDRAIDLTEKINSPNLSMFYLNRGVTRIQLEEYNKALLDYNKTIELNPEFAIAYYNRGLLKNYLKDTKNGCADLNKALELGFNNAKEEIQLSCK